MFLLSGTKFCSPEFRGSPRTSALNRGTPLLTTKIGPILLLAPSVNALQKILHVCEKELDWLDLTIDVSKSSCMRMGPRVKVRCNKYTIVSTSGHVITWSNDIRYLSVYLTANNVYSCSFSHTL